MAAAGAGCELQGTGSVRPCCCLLRVNGEANLTSHDPPTLQRIESLEGHHDRQLHVVYLANDILFKAMSQRPAGSGPEAGGHRVHRGTLRGSGVVQQRQAVLGSISHDLQGRSTVLHPHMGATKQRLSHARHRCFIAHAALQTASRRRSCRGWAACCAAPLCRAGRRQRCG